MYGIQYDENDIPIVYVDGVCTDGGKPSAKAGIGVFFSEHNSFNLSAPMKGKIPSCAEVELQAAARGIEQAARIGLHRVVVATDSQFVIDTATSKIPQYKKDNWRTLNNDIPDYYATLRQLDKAMESMMVVNWKLLKQPTSSTGHIAAYKMAHNGAKLYKRNNTPAINKKSDAVQ